MSLGSEGNRMINLGMDIMRIVILMFFGFYIVW